MSTPAKMNTLKDLYIGLLSDLHSAEKQLAQAWPMLIKTASSPELKTVLEGHGAEIKGQVERLGTVFKKLGQSPSTSSCEPIQDMIREITETSKRGIPAKVLDAWLVGAIQRIEHFEIANYGTACAYAQLLGFEDQAVFLRSSLEEEKKADKRLTSIAEQKINSQAKVA